MPRSNIRVPDDSANVGKRRDTKAITVGADEVHGDVPALSDASSLANVAYTTSNVVLLAANTSRLGASVYNDADRDLFIKLGTTASATSFTAKVAAAGLYEVPSNWVGIISGIWASGGAGAARVTELT